MRRATLAGALLAATAIASAAVDAAPHRPLSYTAQQAGNGRMLYIEHCAECHGGDLTGMYGPALSGPTSRTIYESPQYIYSYLSVAMPHGDPGGLSKDEYVDIMAYLLQQNGRRAGTRKLDAAAIMADTTPLTK